MDDGLRETSETSLLRRGWLARQDAPLAQEILSAGFQQRFGPGTEIYRIGDPGGGVYGVVDGVVVLTIAPTGQQPTIVQHASVGAWLGILPYVGGSVRRATLRTLGEAVLFHLPLEAMREMARRDPRLSRAFDEIAAETMELLFQVIEDLLQPDTGRRVAATLLRATGGGEFRVPLTQLDLATMANASRRQVNTILQGFAARGWIAQGYGSVTVLNAAGLRQSLGGGDERVASVA